MKKIIFICLIFILISSNAFAETSMWQNGLVEFEPIEFLSGTGAFVDAFNFTFTLVSICGFIGACIKLILKVVTRS
jgi:hypothetical protein